MDESLLEIDSKGIIPLIDESREDYLMRGEDFLRVKFDPVMMTEVCRRLANEFPDDYSAFIRTSAPEGAYGFMEEKCDCNLRWVPYFKKIQGEPENKSGGNANAYNVPVIYKGRNVLPAVVIHKDPFEKNTAIHEFIHATRTTFGCLKEYSVIRELFAESYKKIPRHNTFFENEEMMVHTFYNMKNVKEKFRECFGDKADYAFMRLRYEEIENLAWLSVNEADIKDYFKESARVLKCGLRFKIMCEKLGL